MFNKCMGDRPTARIQDMFEKEAQHRSKRTIEEWKNKEIQAVLEQVNLERRLLGKLPVDKTYVEMASDDARGSIDYSSKFAYQAEKLVYK